ncbi:MAG: O-methyltransferase [Candidatus Izemoplasmatales bacterium]
MSGNELKVPSFEKINYSLRPAKNIERKMILEALYRLSSFHSIREYQYIGFGSTFFTDFSLFHKNMGINDLYSIEIEEDYKERFEFNKPFSAINMIYGHSNEALNHSSINWDKRKIVWLDYDYPITADVMIDIDNVIKKCISGDVFLITLNANTKEVYSNPKSSDASIEKAFNKFKSQFILEVGDDEFIDYSDLVDASVKPSDLAGWGLANVCSKIIKKRIHRKLYERNEVNEDIGQSDNLNYKQIFDFHYQDGSMMMTVGFVFYSNSEWTNFNQCNFNDFNFCQNLPFSIKAPNLTFKELQYIDSCLPNNTEKIEPMKIPIEEIEEYIKVYRYFPTFLEAYR